MQKERGFSRKLLGWLDKNLLFYLSALLLIFIPLYPKLPLFDVIPGYIVRVRLEDFLVLFVFLIFLVQVFRRRAKLKNPLLIPIIIYLGIGLLSSLSAMFITKSVPLQSIHVAKLVLHFIRRIEYFSLFFIFFSSIRNRKQIKILIFVLSLVVLSLVIYGLGQKYFGWPVYSTMNREFSKGWRLILREHARVPATFAGHYDLAAFLVLILAIFLSLFLNLREKKLKIWSGVVFALSFILLMYTASRTSFISYIFGISAVAFLLAKRKGWRRGVVTWGLLMAFSFLAMFNFQDISERFSHFFKLDLIQNFVRNKIFRQDQQQYLVLNKDLSLVYTPSDQPPTVFKDDEGNIWMERERELPPDVYEAIPEPLMATESAGEATGAMVMREREYSPYAFLFGLSAAIRFDVLWPRAMERFRMNPVLGTGYSTLTKAKMTDFTEAESTDNDYLRALGETGILGFISFFGIIGITLRKSYRSLSKIKNNFFYALTAGIIGGTIGLLVNALYIDVFEASKVAFMFWAVTGLLMAGLHVNKR